MNKKLQSLQLDNNVYSKKLEQSLIQKQKNVPTPPGHSKLRTKHTMRKYCIVFFGLQTVESIRLTKDYRLNIIVKKFVISYSPPCAVRRQPSAVFKHQTGTSPAFR